ncbi:amino acid permease [Saccharothrix obliqua]|uniref:amino acid permease n=1 Tax=Saccharothrix obliqua TaxID=2861747 RepID=UPI001C603E5C|nr:amino acid permease [Saccharothrix obliqua]MBW4718064.1 amino acid permease [Saccharothrix obliqua]
MARTDDGTHPGQTGRLGVPRLLGLVMATVTPLIVAVAVIPAGYAQTGVTGLAPAFLAVALVMAVFVPGYLAMGRDIGHPGGFYAYAARGLNPVAGAAAAAVALVAYWALLVGLFGVFGSAVGALIGPSAPHWAVTALVALVVVTVLSVLWLPVPTAVVLVALVADVVWCVVTYAALLVSGDVLDAVSTPGDSLHELPRALLLGFLGWVGVETVMIYHRRVRGSRTIGRAVRLMVPLLGALYVLAAIAPVAATGTNGIVAAARTHGDGLVFHLAEQQLGAGWVDIGHVLFAVGAFAAMVSFSMTVSSYVRNLGVDGVLPASLGVLSRRTAAPVRATAALCALTAVAVLTAAAVGWDPVAHVFLGGGAFGALGVLALLVVVAGAVVRYRWRTRGVVLAVVAAVALAGLLVIALVEFDALLSPETVVLRWTVPVVFALVAVAGAVRAWWMRTHDPARYRAIGTTGEAS